MPATVPTTDPVTLPWLEEPLFRCFGCSPRNEAGLALRMFRVDGGRLATDVVFPPRFESYPGVVHGGIVSALVDELMGDLVALDRGMLAFSVSLRTRFLRPLRVGTAYRAVAWVAREATGLLHTEADVSTMDGETHAMASAAYQPISSVQAREHFGLDAADCDRLSHYFDHVIG